MPITEVRIIILIQTPSDVEADVVIQAARTFFRNIRGADITINRTAAVK